MKRQGDYSRLKLGSGRHIKRSGQAWRHRPDNLIPVLPIKGHFLKGIVNF